jgi:hypothetical protein
LRIEGCLALTHPDREPRPHFEAGTQVPRVWPIRASVRCPPVVPPAPASFASILEEGRARHRMQRAPLRELVNALAWATAPRAPREEVVLVDWRGRPRALRYDAPSHRLQLLDVAFPDGLRTFASTCAALLPEAQGTALVLIGHPSHAGAAQEDPRSRAWRDAGALLQTLLLTATAYGLAFCPLGLPGQEVLQAIGMPRDAVATGAALLGRPR